MAVTRSAVLPKEQGDRHSELLPLTVALLTGNTSGDRCMTMAELALAAEDNGDATDYTYGEDPNEASTWDAHRIFG